MPGVLIVANIFMKSRMHECVRLVVVVQGNTMESKQIPLESGSQLQDCFLVEQRRCTYVGSG